MQHRSRRFAAVAAAVLTGVSLLALTSSQPQAQYKLTVNRERLLNAQNEPQNWLMMNGDYGSQRYSKLTQINRENAKDLRLVWALALRGMQNVGQNGPENEVNPLIDNGFMYTIDGWGTIYKIDARNPNKGEFVWIQDSGVRHEGNRAQTRGLALWEDLVIATLPDGRVVALNRDSGEPVWDEQGATSNECATKERLARVAVERHNAAIGQGGDDQVFPQRKATRLRAIAFVAHTGILDPDELALVGVARIDLVDRAPAVDGVHEAVVDERVDLVLGAVLADILQAAQRQRPHHPQVLDVVAVDLGELGIALRAVIAVHHQPVLRLVLGVEQTLAVDGKFVLRSDRRSREHGDRDAGEDRAGKPDQGAGVRHDARHDARHEVLLPLGRLLLGRSMH